jgi:NhaP-type Na+/H+ or K+/H+ antiporter
MCTVSTGLAWALLGLPFVTALLIGAVLAPTDPVLSSAVVTGPMGRRALPERVRELLLSESASNDALGFPLVMLPVLLLTRADSYAWWDWIVRILVWEVAAGSAFGAAAGAVAGLALRAIQRRTDITRSSLLTVSITLAFTVLGGVRLIHGEGLIAVLTAGLVLNHFCGDEMREAREDTHETLRRLFELPMFVILGVVLPWDAWREFGWPLLAFAAALLAFRRLPALFALNRAIAPVQNARETLFVGWFGPIGIAAMLYANLATLRTDNTIAWNVASFVIAASVILHGSSAVVLARRQSIQSD